MLFEDAEPREVKTSESRMNDPFNPGVIGRQYYHGALLMELFSSKENHLADWLQWLESGTGAPPINVQVYRGRNMLIGKHPEFPYDNRRSGIIPLLEFNTGEIETMRGSSPQAQEARRIFLQRLDLHLFGVYGAIGRMSRDAYYMEQIKADFAFSNSLRERHDHRLKITPNPLDLDDPRFDPVPNPITDFDNVARVVHQDAKTVAIRVNLGGVNKNKNEEIIRKMFFITHWQMVQKAYRESGLFKNNMESAIYLLNDFIKSMEATKNQEEIFLLYDRRAWNSIRFRVQLAHQYVSGTIHDFGPQPFIYQTLADVFYPLYPVMGIAVARIGENNYEMKRLFSNENPDPLDRFYEKLVKTRRMSRDFYKRVAGQMPTGSTLTAISKTPQHTQLYESFGFHLDKSEFNPEWQTQMDTLSETRENILTRLSGNKTE